GEDSQFERRIRQGGGHAREESGEAVSQPILRHPAQDYGAANSEGTTSGPLEVVTRVDESDRDAGDALSPPDLPHPFVRRRLDAGRRREHLTEPGGDLRLVGSELGLL